VLLLLKRSGCLIISASCGEAVGEAAGASMKISTIRLPDVGSDAGGCSRATEGIEAFRG